MKKLISHFSYLNFSREISRMEISRFLVSHEELRRVLLTYLVYQLEACFFGGKPFELMSWLRSHKKLTLGKQFFAVTLSKMPLSAF